MMRKKYKKSPYAFDVACFILAAVLFSYSIFSQSPQQLATNASSMLAEAIIGISASVSPNPDNTLAAEFAAKEKELDARQKNIDLLEKQATTANAFAVYSFILSICLLILVALNYYFDWHRAKRSRLQSA